MRAYKMEVLIIDHDDVGLQAKNYLENGNFPNDCIRPQVLSMKIADIGEWSDDHPLNRHDTFGPYVEGLFKVEDEDGR
jgi:hypothetical protein